MVIIPLKHWMFHLPIQYCSVYSRTENPELSTHAQLQKTKSTR